jgi:hypothetical protein
MVSKLIGAMALLGGIISLSGQPILPSIASAQPAMLTATPEIFWIKIQFRGGMRATRTIPELMIRPDGLYRYNNGVSKPKSGMLSQQELRLLKQRVQQANFSVIKSQPFKGTCPIAYDGIEVAYLFQLNRGVEEISACKYAINGKSLLFQQLNRLSQTLSN